MEWKDVGGKIASAAPLLGSLFGPAGAGIGAGIKLLASAFGLTETETTPDKVSQLLGSDPQAAIKLAEIEANNKIELQRLVLESERIRLGDVASARAREVETTRATGSRDVNLYLLAWLVVIGFFGLLAVLMFVDLPSINVGPVNQLFGAVAAGFGMVLQYFFGSSKSSADKNVLLAGKV